MSYRQSRARREFNNQLDSAMKELVLLHKFAVTHGDGSRLLGAYYVFAYSQLEVYIKSFVEDTLTAVVASAPAFDKWPDLMLGYLLHKSEKLAANYRKYGVDDDEGAILGKVALTARKVASWKVGAQPLAVIDAAEFLEKKTYPSPKNLPQLFKRLGVTHIWAVTDRAGRFNGELILTSLNDLRTGIAHEGKIPPGISLGDVRNRVDQMRRFVAAIDRGVAQHFCSGLIRRAAWNVSVS